MRISRVSTRTPRHAPAARRESMLAAALVLAAVAALASHACTATSYLDPEGPRYYGSGSPVKPGASAASAEGPLRVVTLNLEFGRETEGAVRLIQGDEALRNPDLLLLQEMSGAGVARIAGALGLNYLSYPSGVHPQAKQEYGAAILSPWPIESPAKLLLPHVSAINYMRRAVTAGTVIWRGLPVRVYSVHLPSPLAITVEQRQEQVAAIVEAARRDQGPVIVAGDFNSSAVGPWFEANGFLWVTREAPGTARRFGLRFRLDHVFVRGLKPAAETPFGCVEAPGISDHCAVWALLEPGPPFAS